MTMKTKHRRRCSRTCDCKDEISRAKKFVGNLKLTKDKRGTFSIVHFDLKGSTKLMRKEPIKSITRMLLHNKMCRNVVEKNGGFVFKELGDAILVRFKGEGEACECAIKVIRNLKRHGGGMRTKVTVASGTLWKVKTDAKEDVYGVPVNLCNRMSKHAQENRILFEESSYVAVQNWLSDEKRVRFVRVKHGGKDPELDDFGRTPLRKIIVN